MLNTIKKERGTMNESNILPALNNVVGYTVMKLTTGISDEPFIEQSEEHLLSVVSYYVEKEMKISSFIEIISETYNLLKKSGGWQALSLTLLSTNDRELKEVLLRDALFHTEEGWEKEAESRKNNVISYATKRLEQLV